jgi:hypothetical protein
MRNDEIISRIPDRCQSDNALAFRGFHNLQDLFKVGGICLDIRDIWMGKVDSSDFIFLFGVESDNAMAVCKSLAGCL